MNARDRPRRPPINMDLKIGVLKMNIRDRP
jgi:hypothetical protein